MTEVTIGGSQAAAAVGLDPFKSQVALWAELTGRLEPREAGEPALWGQLLEPVVREQVKASDYFVQEWEADRNMTDAPEWMTAHLDGVVFKSATTGYPTPTTTFLSDAGVYEGKTCGPWVRGWEDDGVPPAYVVQTHHYMIYGGFSWGLLACLVAGQRLELREIERDESLCQLIIELEGEFVEHVRTDTPPPPDGNPATTEVLKRLYPEATGEIVALTSDDYTRVEELRKIKKQAKLVETEQARLENELKARLGDAAVATFDGEKVVSWSNVTSRRFDQTAFKEQAAPELYELFVRESSYRRFVVHGT